MLESGRTTNDENEFHHSALKMTQIVFFFKPNVKELANKSTEVLHFTFKFGFKGRI